MGVELNPIWLSHVYAQGVLAGLFPAAAADKTLEAEIELNGTHHDEFMVRPSKLLKRFHRFHSGGNLPAGLPPPLG